MASFDRYQKRLRASAKNVREVRKQSAIDINDRAFEYADGYQVGYIMDRIIPDNGLTEWDNYDFLIKHTLTETEKKVIARPETEIATGSYIKYAIKSKKRDITGEYVYSERDVIMIIRGRILDDTTMPSYKAYVCGDKLRLKGCPYEFPVYGFNSTYSSKGMIDSDQVNTIDSRNKIYVQKNKYTIKLYENHKNYRIVLGTEETKYYYFITEMDDISYPGMFVISLKTDERHPNDDGFYAHNERKIDFGSVVTETSKVASSPEIICNSYFKVGVESEINCNKDVQSWNMNTEYFSVVSTESKRVKVIPVKAGLVELKITDVDGKETTKNVMIKAGDS